MRVSVYGEQNARPVSWAPAHPVAGSQSEAGWLAGLLARSWSGVAWLLGRTRDCRSCRDEGRCGVGVVDERIRWTGSGRSAGSVTCDAYCLGFASDSSAVRIHGGWCGDANATLGLGRVHATSYMLPAPAPEAESNKEVETEMTGPNKSIPPQSRSTWSHVTHHKDMIRDIFSNNLTCEEITDSSFPFSKLCITLNLEDRRPAKPEDLCIPPSPRTAVSRGRFTPSRTSSTTPS